MSYTTRGKAKGESTPPLQDYLSETLKTANPEFYDVVEQQRQLLAQSEPKTQDERRILWERVQNDYRRELIGKYASVFGVSEKVVEEAVLHGMVNNPDGRLSKERIAAVYHINIATRILAREVIKYMDWPEWMKNMAIGWMEVLTRVDRYMLSWYYHMDEISAAFPDHPLLEKPANPWLILRRTSEGDLEEVAPYEVFSGRIDDVVKAVERVRADLENALKTDGEHQGLIQAYISFLDAYKTSLTATEANCGSNGEICPQEGAEVAMARLAAQIKKLCSEDGDWSGDCPPLLTPAFERYLFGRVAPDATLRIILPEGTDQMPISLSQLETALEAVRVSAEKGWGREESQPRTDLEEPPWIKTVVVLAAGASTMGMSWTAQNFPNSPRAQEVIRMIHMRSDAWPKFLQLRPYLRRLFGLSFEDSATPDDKRQAERWAKEFWDNLKVFVSAHELAHSMLVNISNFVREVFSSSDWGQKKQEESARAGLAFEELKADLAALAAMRRLLLDPSSGVGRETVKAVVETYLQDVLRRLIAYFGGNSEGLWAHTMAGMVTLRIAQETGFLNKNEKSSYWSFDDSKLEDFLNKVEETLSLLLDIIAGLQSQDSGVGQQSLGGFRALWEQWYPKKYVDKDGKINMGLLQEENQFVADFLEVLGRL